MVRFKVWLTDNPTATTTMVLDELRSIQTMASLRPADRIIIYLGAVFSDKIIAEKEVLIALPTAYLTFTWSNKILQFLVLSH